MNKQFPLVTEELRTQLENPDFEKQVKGYILKLEQARANKRFQEYHELRNSLMEDVVFKALPSIKAYFADGSIVVTPRDNPENKLVDKYDYTIGSKFYSELSNEPCVVNPLLLLKYLVQEMRKRGNEEAVLVGNGSYDFVSNKIGIGGNNDDSFVNIHQSGRGRLSEGEVNGIPCKTTALAAEWLTGRIEHDVLLGHRSARPKKIQVFVGVTKDGNKCIQLLGAEGGNNWSAGIDFLRIKELWFSTRDNGELFVCAVKYIDLDAVEKITELTLFKGNPHPGKILVYDVDEYKNDLSSSIGIDTWEKKA